MEWESLCVNIILEEESGGGGGERGNVVNGLAAMLKFFTQWSGDWN